MHKQVADDDFALVPDMVGVQIPARYFPGPALGEGGYGKVFRCWDDEREEAVAVKIVWQGVPKGPAERTGIAREIAAMQKLGGLSGFVEVYDSGPCPGSHYIAMRLMEGGSLKDVRVACGGRVPVKEALALAITIGKRLVAAHDRGVTHRDVKPENVLFDAARVLHLADFGIALILEKSFQTVSRPSVMATREYAAQEILLGRASSPRSDVFSLGVVLYELLIGRVPARDPGGRWRWHGLDACDPPDAELDRLPAFDIGPRFDLMTLLRDMMRWRSIQRPTAADVAARLEAILARLPPEPDA